MLFDYLPVVLRFHAAELLYSPKVHGLSVNTFFNKCEEQQDPDADLQAMPTLFIIEESDGTVFGGFASEKWRPMTKYYGTGDSFLFKLVGPPNEEAPTVWPASLANSHFQYSTEEAPIAMGGGSAGFALCVDAEWMRGLCAQNCETFGMHEPIVEGKEEFIVRDIEVWHLVPP